MNITIHQNIVIHHLSVDSVSNAAVLQIGSAGSISSLARVANSGRFIPGPMERIGAKTLPSLVPLPAT